MPSRRVADLKDWLRLSPCSSLVLFLDRHHQRMVRPTAAPACSQRHTARIYRKVNRHERIDRESCEVTRICVNSSETAQCRIALWTQHKLADARAFRLHYPLIPLSDVAHKIDRAGQRHGDLGELASTITVYGRLRMVVARSLQQDR